MENKLNFNFSYDPTTGILRNEDTGEEFGKINKNNAGKVGNSIVASIRKGIAQYDHQVRFNKYKDNPELGAEDPEYIIEKYYGKLKSWAPTSTRLFRKVINELLERGREDKNTSEVIDLNFIDTKNIRSMARLFDCYTSAGYIKAMPSIDISKWDVSNVTDMHAMFSFANFSNTIDISNWNVSNVENMSSMFANSNFRGDISKWDVSNVTNMNSMFSWSKFDGDISNWDVSNATDVWGMFSLTPLERNNNLPAWYLEREEKDTAKRESVISGKLINKLQERNQFSKDIHNIMNN